MVERIKQLMESKGLTSTQLADTIGIPRAVVSHILSGRNKPSLDVVLKIISSYREVSMDWLLLGEGDMLINLASADKPRMAAQAPGTQQNNAPPEAPKPETPTEKVQDLPVAVSVTQTAEKAVEQVMIFYSDRTFSTYKPS